jgi:hypothetical protein
MPLTVAQERRSAVQVAPTYPQLARVNEFSVLTRLHARLNAKDVGNGVYLAFCSRHHAYFLDLKHTNGVLRCPVCDDEWLLERGF